MSKTVDERVVEMRFDNKQFEDNVKTTMSSLDKLKEKLNFHGASKGLENIGAAADKVNMSGLSGAVETVHAKFSALEVVGMTALANITNSAINTGKQLVSAFTIDPVKSGFQEYETQIGAVQTILANTSSKGTTLDQVNAALDELNTYADKTIYNFTEMTRNIGTFTAAGVDLDTSVSAIQGIANLAAVSGSTSQQASTAMYQLSQALATGTVKLQDWNSVVNAGMGGEVFQNALKRTATAMGTNVDAMIEKYGSFRDSLTQGNWLTTEVLTETLNQFTMAAEKGSDEWDKFKASLTEKGYTEEQAVEILDMANTATDAATKVKTFTQLMDTLKETAQSGWTQTWELLVGDFEEAKSLFTELSDTFSELINDSANSRNNLLKGALSSNWDKLEEEVTNAGVSFEEFQNTLKETAKTNGVAIDEIIEKEGSLENAFKHGKLSSSLIIETLKKFAGVTTDASKATSEVTGKLEEFEDVVNRVIRGDFGNGEARVKALTEAGYDYATVQGLVNDVLAGGKIEISELSDAQLKNLGYTEDQIAAIKELAEQAEKTGTPINELINNLSKPSGRELLIDSLRNALDGLTGSIKVIKEARNEIFDGLDSTQLYGVIEAVNKFSEKLRMTDATTGELNETAQKLKRTLKGLFAIIDIISTITGGGLKIGLKALCKILCLVDVDILDVTASAGDAVVAFRDWLFENNLLVKGFNKLYGGAKKGITMIQTWINKFINLPIVQNNITRFEKAFSSTFNNLSAHFSKGITRIDEFIERVKAMDHISIDDLDDIFKDFKDNVIDYFFDVDGCFDNIEKAVTDFKEEVKTRFGEAGESVDALKIKIFDFVESVKKKIEDNMAAILTVGIGIGFIVSVKKLTDTINEWYTIFKKAVPNLNGLINSLSSSLLKLSKSKAFEMKTEGILNIAKAIAILAASLVVLTKVDPGKLWSAVGALSVLMIVLTGLSFAIAKVEKFGDFSKASLSLVALSGSLLILVTALKQMESLNLDTLPLYGLALGMLATGLTILAAIMGKVSPQLSKGGIFLIAFSASLKILVSALSDLETINSDKIKGSIPMLLGTIVGLGLVAKACGNVKISSAITILAVVVALKILIRSLDDIADLDVGKIKANVKSLIPLFGMMSLVILSTQLAGKNASKAGVAILGMSAGLLLMAGAFKILAAMESTDLDRCLDCVSKMVLVFAAVIAVSKLAGQHAAKAGVMLLEMSGAMLALAAAMVIISYIEPSGLKRALGAVRTLMLLMGVLIAATSLAKDCKSTLIILSVTVVALATALATLSMINPDNLKGATIALSLVIGVFALMIASTKFAQKATGTLIVMSLVVGVLGGILYALSTLPAKSAIGSASALSILMVTLSACMIIVGNASAVAPMALVALAGMTLIVAGLGAILYALAGLPVESTLGVATSLSMLLLALSATTLILSAIPIVGALSAIANLAIMIAGIAGILYALTKLSDNIGDLSGGIHVLEQIGNAIGGFIGSIIRGFGEGLTSALPEIGNNLSMFMLSVQGFIIGSKMIDDSALSGVKTLAEAILILTGTEIIQGLAKLLPGKASLSDFATELEDLGPALSTFASEVSGIENMDDIEPAANALKAITSFASAIPNEGGLLADLIGDNTLAKFGEELAEFGPNFSTYADSVKDINPEVIEKSANAASALASFADAIPNQGGVLADLVGDNTLSTFAEELKAFAPAFVEYANKMTEITDMSIVEKSSAAAKTLAEFANAIPNQGGVLADLIGDNTLSAFAEGLEDFAPEFVEYANKMAEITDMSVVEKSVVAAKTISAFATNLPNSGGVISWFTGDNDIGTFGDNLSKFGEKFAEYYGYVKDINTGIVDTSIGIATSVSGLVKNLPSSGGILSNKTTLTDLGGDMVGFGKKLATFYESVSGTNVTVLSGVIEETNHLVSMAKGMEGIDTKAMGSFGKALTTVGKNGIDGFIKAFADSETKSIAAVVKLVDATSASIKTKYTDFYTAGTYLVDGFVNGISANIVKAAAMAASMAAAAITAAKKKLDEHSPSKVFYGIGDYAGLGFVNALADSASRSYEAGTGLAKSAISGTSKAISKISDIINSDIDPNPTIRPVLDVSNVESGASYIGSLLAGRKTLSVDTRTIGAVSVSMQKLQNRNDSSELLSAIQKLGKDLSNRTGDTYNVNGVTYDDGSNVSSAVKSLIRAARIERRAQ